MEEDKSLVEQRLSSQSLEQVDREERLNSSIRKLIGLTGTQEKGDCSEVL